VSAENARVLDLPTPIDPTAADLYRELDALHGQILRAKYRLCEKPDADALAEIIDSIPFFASRAYAEWQAYEARNA
jgi:hypothetical protein